MKTKEEIVANWLPRYTKRKLEDFGEYILLTNFNKYVEIFAERFNVPILGRDARRARQFVRLLGAAASAASG